MRTSRPVERTAFVLATLLITATPIAAPAQEAAPPRLSSEVTDVGALRRVRDAFIAAGDFGAALAPAERVVEQRRGTDDPEFPGDLARLARIQAELEEFEAAEVHYLEAIDLISAAEGEFSITLVEPYQGLGRSYIQNRQFVEAITALEQAQHVSQRNLGLFNVSQTALLDDLTTAHLGLGDTTTAQRLQIERLENAIRRFGANDLQVIPFRYQLAGYYEQSRLRAAAREQYEEVLTALAAQPDATDAALLPPLRRLLRIELLLDDRDDARERIAAILGREAQLEPAERAASLAALGDWAIAHDDHVTAGSYYGEAYALLRETPAERDELFARPEMLDFIAPLTGVDRATRSRPYAWGTIVLEFDVGPDGRASNVDVVSSQPAHAVASAYVRRIRETHFRPRIVGGAPVATRNARFTHYFRYYVED